MFSIRQPKILTALAIVGIASYCVVRGGSVAVFAVKELRWNRATVTEDFGGYVNDWGVAARARRDIMAAGAAALPDAAARKAALVGLLTITPLDSMAWYRLAQARFATAEPIGQVVSALTVSSLTGPNELESMSARALFGLRIWALLPPVAQRAVVSDLVGAWRLFEAPYRATLRSVAMSVDDGPRQTLRALLLTTNAAAISTALGLDPAPPAPTGQP